MGLLNTYFIIVREHTFEIRTFPFLKEYIDDFFEIWVCLNPNYRDWVISEEKTETFVRKKDELYSYTNLEVTPNFHLFLLSDFFYGYLFDLTSGVTHFKVSFKLWYSCLFEATPDRLFFGYLTDQWQDLNWNFIYKYYD